MISPAPIAGAPVAAIARAEWRLILRRRSYAWLMAGFALLLAFAAVLGGQRQRREAAQQRDYQRLVRAQWESQPDRHPHRVAHYGTFAFKPVGPLLGKLLSEGSSDTTELPLLATMNRTRRWVWCVYALLLVTGWLGVVKPAF